MAQFRSTADLLDKILDNCGEVTNGNSPYETQVLNFLNRVHHTLIAGGTIPIGKDQTVEIDEVWPWAKAKSPLLLALEAPYETGTITLTNGSEAGTFSSAVTNSLKGWHLNVKGEGVYYKIISHAAGGTAFELDSHYLGASSSGLSYKAVKLDYELSPSHLYINVENNKLQFQETAGTTLTATLNSGTYSPSDLATQIQTQMNATGGTPAYTVSYSSTTRKFTIASDRAGGSVFILVGIGDQSEYSVHRLIGFDDENTTNASSITSTYPLGSISRLVEPFKVFKGTEGLIYGVDAEKFAREYPFSSLRQSTPDRFCVIKEDANGLFTVRFNGYPDEKTKVDIEYVPAPIDLKDNSSSIPLIPRKWVDVLEDAATFYLMLLKSDDRAQVYANLAQGKLKAMVSQNRGQQSRSGKNFGQMIARRDNVAVGRTTIKFWGEE